MTMKRPDRECATRCNGGPSRPHFITEVEFERISQSAHAACGHSLVGVFRCNYCGCVYVRNDTGARVIGYLDASMPHHKRPWDSADYP